MHAKRSTSRICTALFGVMLLLIAAADLNAQAVKPKCLQPGKSDEIRAALRSGTVGTTLPLLRMELITGGREIGELTKKAVAERPADGEAMKAFNAYAARWAERICRTLNESGWPMRSAIDTDGSNAFLFLILKALPVEQRLELYPIVAAALEAKQIDGSETLAAYVDGLRLAIGRKQVYGSQAYVRDGFLVMAPIENIANVDKRRAAFGLRPLREYERSLEILYRTPLIRLVSEPPLTTSTAKPDAPINDALSATDAAEEIKVETAFVSVDVMVPESVDAAARPLEKSDFQLFDNGKQVEIETFAKADTPFDIVLMLDLSGSTSDQVGLIKRTTRRFVETKRPNDRLAVVTFHDFQTIVSELESDPKVLLERIKKIGGNGGSNIWESVKFGLDMLERSSSKGRRKAVVLMSDGIDNQLTFYQALVPRLSYADLVEAVRRSETAIFPVYLEPSRRGPDYPERILVQSRGTMAYLADQTGGNLYSATKLADLEGIYDRIIKDVGTVYTLGFTPDTEGGSTEWRPLRVEVPSRTGLKLKYRPGYFTR